MSGAPIELGPMPLARRMRTVDERTVDAAVDAMFDLARDVEAWPHHLPHYRYVRFHDRRQDGGGVVEMAAYRPFGVVRWPTWSMADMQVLQGVGSGPAIRFRHIAGVTRGMEVEWSFTPADRSFAPTTAAVATFVRIVHLWDGPRWPVVGGTIATSVIGPVFIHGIASRTLAGLATAAERVASHRVPADRLPVTRPHSQPAADEGART